MASNVDIEADTEGQSTGQWLTVPLAQDWRGLHEFILMNEEYQMIQQSHEPITSVEGSGEIGVPYGDQLLTTPLTQDDGFVGGLLLVHHSSSAFDEGTVEPSVLTIGQEFEGSIEDEAIESRSEDDEVWSGPSRKVKKLPPITKEQQQSSILQIKAMLSMHNADPSSRKFKNAPLSVKQAASAKACSDSSGPLDGKEVTTNSTEESSPYEKGPRKRGYPPNSSQSTQERVSKKKKKDVTRTMSQEAITTLDLLQKLGRPVERDISQVVTYASDVLDAQENSAAAIEELLGMEQEWKSVHAEKLKQMTALLERYGIIPMGGVEAMSEIRTGST